jgi:fimbrial chaperone protein
MACWLRVLLAAWLLAGPGSASAGGFSVMPTRLQLAAERAVQSVLLTNTSSQTIVVESQVLVWPEGSTGQLASDVIVSPAVVTLPPGQRMRVRIGLLRAGSGESERAYRLYFTELPAPSPLQAAGIGVRLRVGIPVFVPPLQARPMPPRWLARQAADGWQLEAHNPGNVHLRLAEPTLLDGAAATRLELPSPYLLAGATLRLALPPGQPLPAATATRWNVRWMDGDDVRDAAVALP